MPSSTSARLPPPYAAATAPFPQIHLLGNGGLSSWVSDSGGSGLIWHSQALTRFVPDETRDAQGLWIYLLDEESGTLWSATAQPTGGTTDDYRVLFHPHLVEFRRREQEILTTLEVAVAAGVDLETRRLVIVNESDRPRRLRLTSYGEVVLAPPLDDERHPTFSKLFVGGEYLPELGGLLFTRRPRSPAETPPALVHFVVTDCTQSRRGTFECDRRRFLGRGGSLRNPPGARQALSGTQGWTLDPIMALQLSIELQSHERRELCFATIAAATREAAIEEAERHTTLTSHDRAIGDAADETARALATAGVDPRALPALGMVASLLAYPTDRMGCEAARRRENRLGQSHLWGLAISGDLPILLLKSRTGDSGLLKTLVPAQQWWRHHGMQVDLVVLQRSDSAYDESLREDVVALLRDLDASEMLGRKGGVHLLPVDQIAAEQVVLLEASARVVLDDAKGSLDAQLDRAMAAPMELPRFSPSRPADDAVADDPVESDAALLLWNGIGGFTEAGREYVIRMEPGQPTPAPWCNFLANEDFGTVVSEAGLGFSWALNSGENRLTPWNNDPVADPSGEALYLRDEETAQTWSPTPAPAGPQSCCEVRHGAGFSQWRRHSHGLDQTLSVFVPLDGPVKLVRLTLANRFDRPRRLTATYYAEWLLGALRSRSREHVRVTFDADADALFARSYWDPSFAGRVAFLGASENVHGFTTSRCEFLGRNGDVDAPAALRRAGLGGQAEGTGETCGACQVHLALGPRENRDLLFVIGQGQDEDDARSLLSKWRSLDAAAEALAALERHWDSVLGAVTVATPDPSFDILVNRWLLYQSLSSRLLARTGFYQPGGAIGFRDQLQDVLALIHVDPQRVRSHILLAAAHQFEEGDVLHWWHPPSDSGVRTRYTDDLLWLPYATGTYVQATGDLSILDEKIPFLEAPELTQEEEDRYARFEHGEDAWPLLEHCHRALQRASTCGPHGLPLIGGGDWSDGLNRVGRLGRGESVWLAWFAAVTARLVADLDQCLGDDAAAAHWRNAADELVARAEENGWDGAWYRRAYDDDGRPLGAACNEEARIDSIAQSWAAFAGAQAERVKQALDSAVRELLLPDEGLARLLWPPFHSGPGDPGYIKAYPPGVRENGGQYSHAAAWLGIALARQGDGAAAKRLFDMLNPILHSRDSAAAEHYRLEPYVVAGDISGADPYRGRGGWSWYTGAAAWAWRLAVEEILGLRRVEGRLLIDPCLPPGWRGYEAMLRSSSGAIRLRVSDPEGLGRGHVALEMEGCPIDGAEVDFPLDGSVRNIEARLFR